VQLTLEGEVLIAVIIVAVSVIVVSVIVANKMVVVPLFNIYNSVIRLSVVLLNALRDAKCQRGRVLRLLVSIMLPVRCVTCIV
jgi:hypothetical protein